MTSGRRHDLGPDGKARPRDWRAEKLRREERMAADDDETTEAVEPKRDAAPKASGRKRSHRGKTSVEPRMRVMLAMIGTAWKAADETCGGAFLEASPDLAKAINLWAQQDAKLYAWIDGMTSASGPMAVMVALMPVAQTVAYHHLVPAIQRRRAELEEVPVYQPTVEDVLDYVDESVAV